MLEDSDIERMAGELVQRGTTHFTDTDGLRLVIAVASLLGFERNEFMLIYENRGAAFFTLDREMNQYRLASAGFSLRIAPSLADTVNRLFSAVAANYGNNAPTVEGLVPNKEISNEQ